MLVFKDRPSLLSCCKFQPLTFIKKNQRLNNCFSKVCQEWHWLSQLECSTCSLVFTGPFPQILPCFTFNFKRKPCRPGFVKVSERCQVDVVKSLVFLSLIQQLFTLLRSIQIWYYLSTMAMFPFFQAKSN